MIHFIGTWFERPWFKGSVSKYREVYLKFWNELFEETDLQKGETKKIMLTMYHNICRLLLKMRLQNIYFWFRYSFVQKIKINKRRLF